MNIDGSDERRNSNHNITDYVYGGQNIYGPGNVNIING